MREIAVIRMTILSRFIPNENHRLILTICPSTVLPSATVVLNLGSNKNKNKRSTTQARSTPENPGKQPHTYPLRTSSDLSSLPRKKRNESFREPQKRDPKKTVGGICPICRIENLITTDYVQTSSLHTDLRTYYIFSKEEGSVSTITIKKILKKRSRSRILPNTVREIRLLHWPRVFPYNIRRRRYTRRRVRRGVVPVPLIPIIILPRCSH